MPVYSGVATNGGVPVDAATVQAYKASRFGTPPTNGTAPPGSPDAGPVTTGPSYGSTGAWQLTVPTDEDYWIALTVSASTSWRFYTGAAVDDVLLLAGSQTVTGQKTFTSSVIGPLTDNGGVVFTAKAFGAVADGFKQSSDIVDVQGVGTTRTSVGGMASGSALLNDTGNTFTGLDLGKVIQVTGAGPGGVNLHSVILAVNSATQIQLKEKCQTAATNAVYTYGGGASMAVGSGSLNDNNNAIFTGQHIGYVVRVKGAGASGGDLVTTATSINVPAYGTNCSGALLNLANNAGTEVICASWTIGPGSLSGQCNGTTTFKDTANGNWTADTDVGKQILIIGGAGGTTDLLTTITAVTSATQVTLANAAYNPTGRTDTVTTPAGTGVGGTYVVNDVSALAADVGKQVSGTGVTVGTVVIAASAGVSLTLSLPVPSTTTSITVTPNNAYMYANGGAMTSGSAVLTDPNHTFSAADVGKLVTVRNAITTTGWGQGTGTINQQNNSVNCNANTLLTTVASFNPAAPHSVTLSANATATTFCATYALGHDDTAAITSALTACQAAGGGTVRLGSGIHCITSSLQTTGGAPYKLCGDGRHTPRLLLMAAIAGTGTGMVSAVSSPVEVDGVSFEGNLLCPQLLTCSTNQATVRGIFVHGCRFTESSQTNGGQWTVKFNSNHSFLMQDVTFSDCHIVNVPTSHQDIVSFDQCDGVLMSNCVVENVNQAVYPFGAINVQIADNVFRQVHGRTSSSLTVIAYGCGIVGNDFISCDALGPGGQTQGLRVVGNNFFDTPLAFSSSSSQQMDVAVTGNAFTFPANSQQGTVIAVGGVFGFAFVGNVIDAAHNPLRVFYLQSGATAGFASGDISITGNTFNTAVTGSNKILSVQVDPLVEPTPTPGAIIGNGSGVLSVSGSPFPYDSNSGGTVTYQAGDSNSGATVSYTANTLTDTAKTWTFNQWANVLVTVGSVTGVVASNTATVITLTANWSSTPAAQAAYVISASLKDTAKTWTANQWVGQSYAPGIVVTGTTDVSGTGSNVGGNTASVLSLTTATWTGGTPAAGTQYAVSTVVGLPSWLPGAGRGGTPLLGKITDVYSASSVGLSNNAQQTVSGATGYYGGAGGGSIADNILDAANSGGQGLVISSSSFAVHDNVFRGFTSGSAIVDTGTITAHDNKILSGTVSASATSTYRNNTGYNPQGDAAITVGASPFTYTNNDGVDELVYVTGGTISALTSNGETVAVGSTALFTPPGNSVVVTYSAAPTMRKFRL